MRMLASRAWALAAVAVVLAFYGWTAWTAGALPPQSGPASDYDNTLVHSLLKGHLYLDLPVDPTVLRARDPYDFEAVPAQRRMVDSSYYRGHYYSYFGVVPPVLVLLPFRLLTGGDLALPSAVVLLASAAFLALSALWWRLCRRYFPRQLGWAGASGILMVGLSGGLLALVRRPWIYEFAIAGGALFLALFLHCLASALVRRRPAAGLGWAGVFLGLAVGSRPNLLLTGLAAVIVLGWLWREDRSLRPLAAFTVSFGAVFAVLLVYNAARFGSPLEFGFKYQLTWPKAADRHFLGLHYFAYNVAAYFLNGLKWSRLYPFVQIVAAGNRPEHYFLSEWVYGLLKYSPVLWFVPAAIWLGRERRILAGLLAGAWLGPLAFDLFIESSALRYEADFAPLLLLTGGLGALALAERGRSLWPPLFAAAAVFGASVAALQSIPLYGVINQTRGAAFCRSLARTLNQPGFWYERLRGWHYGPVSMTATFGEGRGEQKLVSSPECSLVAEYPLDTRGTRLGLRFGPGDDVVWSPALLFGRHSIQVAFGALYPQVEHPYYDKHRFDPDHAGAYQVEVDGRSVLQGYRLMAPMDCKDIVISSGDARPGTGWFTGAVAEVRRNQFAAAADFDREFEPWTLSLRVPPTGIRTLWSADGPAGRDELQLVVEPAVRSAHYRYRPAIGVPVNSPAFSCAPGERLRPVVGAQDLAPTLAAAGSSRLLWIEQDGKLFWQAPVASSGASPRHVSLGEGVAREQTEPARAPERCDETLLLRVTLPTQQNILEHDPILMLGAPGDADGVTIIYNTRTSVRFAFDHWGRGWVAESETVESDPAVPHEIEVRARPHGDGQGTVQISFDGRRVMDAVVPMYPEVTRAAYVAVNPSHMTGEPRFTGSVLLQRWVR
ncbi:MAG TPA: hypothetical protein VGL42_02740 [Opitutaceae bacterium]